MNGSARFTWIALLLSMVGLTTMLADGARGQTEEAGAGAASTAPATAKQAAERKREERREFQLQELMLAKSGTWIFKPGETPRILWRDVETVRRLGCSEPLRVRWFDAELNESPEPSAPGRWIAWIEGTAPNGTPLRRSRTFYALPKQLPSSLLPDLIVAFPNFPGPEAPAVLALEFLQTPTDGILQSAEVLGCSFLHVHVAVMWRAPGSVRRFRFSAAKAMPARASAPAGPGSSGRPTTREDRRASPGGWC